MKRNMSFLSVLLSLVLVTGSVPGMNPAAYAAEAEVTESGTLAADSESMASDIVEKAGESAEQGTTEAPAEENESVKETEESVEQGTTETPAEENESVKETEESVEQGTTEASSEENEPAEAEESEESAAEDAAVAVEPENTSDAVVGEQTKTEIAVTSETVTVKESAKDETDTDSSAFEAPTVVAKHEGDDTADGERAEVLFDGVKTTKWSSYTKSAGAYKNRPADWVIFKYSNAIKAEGYILTTGNETKDNGGRNWKDWRVYGTNEEISSTYSFEYDNNSPVIDTTVWELVHKVTDDTVLPAENTVDCFYSVSSEKTYKYFLLVIDDIQSKEDNIHQMGEMTVGNHTLTVTGGNNATVTSGNTQSVVTSFDIGTINYKANDGYSFPDFETFSVNGIKVEKVSDAEVTVSGKPDENKDTSIEVPDAVKNYTVTFNANGHGTAPAAQTVKEGGTVEKPSDPTETGYTFDGWYTEAACTNAYDFSTAVNADFTLYAKWKKQISVTVTFKVVNGSWNDGTAVSKAVTLTGYEGDTLKLASDQIPSVGSNPSTNYKAGSWDVTPSTSTAITADTTYTYTYAEKEKISATVTFKVANGSWNDGTKASKTVTLTGYEGDTLMLASGQIPSVGSNPNTNYKAGSWDVTPSTSTEITADTTYIYTYAQKEKISATVTFKVVNGSWNDKTTEKKTVTLTGYEGDTLKLASDDIPEVGSNPNTNYKAGSWDVTPNTKTEITKNTTYTYTYAKKSTSSSSSSSSTSAKTGDNSMIWLWGAIIAASVAGLAAVIIKRRGKKN